MPYWNEIPGGGKFRPLTEKESRFFAPLLKIYLIIGFVGTGILMAIFLWPAFILIGIGFLRFEMTKRSSRKIKKQSPRESSNIQQNIQLDLPLSSAQINAQRRRILGKQAD